jgi:hypothetical protein
MLGRWEWIVIELLVLGFLIAELISVRRSIAKDKQKQDWRERAAPPNPPAMD